MLSAIFLLPLVAAVPLKPLPKNYILDVEDGTLRDIQFDGDAPLELDLSGMQLRALAENALGNVPNLKSLDLSNNTLESLPEFIFSNLTDLEELSLAENKIRNLQNLFVGLEKLRSLNISYNPVVHLRRGHLFGLPKSTTICADGNIFWSISTGAFTNSFLKDEVEMKDLEGMNHQESPDEHAMEKEKETEENPTASKVLEKDPKLKLCMSDKIVVSLEPLVNETLPEGCSKLSVDRNEKKVNLRGLGIKGFQEGWYQLQSLPIVSLDFSNNEITEITKETLNDLPEGLTYVNFLSNRIRKIWSQVIENQYLRRLNFKENLIASIETGALEKTNLSGLFLTDNQLESLNFVSSLPQTLKELVLTGNQITEIPDKCFSALPGLYYLNLGNNRIVRLQNNVFKGLDSLSVLIITRNSLTAIEHKAFKDLKQLRHLYLYRNSLTEIEKGTFSDLENLKDLNLGWNKLTKITKNTFSNLPKSLDDLHIDLNEIDSLEAGSFNGVPKFTLSMSGNKISTIPRGAFDLPTLRDLHLSNNTLTTMDGDSFEGLPQLKRLWLTENRISVIEKGACKNLYGLNVLDISKNPFQKLDNGALYGLSTTRESFVFIYNNQLKQLQAGIFDDV